MYCTVPKKYELAIWSKGESELDAIVCRVNELATSIKTNGDAEKVQSSLQKFGYPKAFSWDLIHSCVKACKSGEKLEVGFPSGSKSPEEYAQALTAWARRKKLQTGGWVAFCSAPLVHLAFLPFISTAPAYTNSSQPVNSLIAFSYVLIPLLLLYIGMFLLLFSKRSHPGGLCISLVCVFGPFALFRIPADDVGPPIPYQEPVPALMDKHEMVTQLPAVETAHVKPVENSVNFVEWQVKGDLVSELERLAEMFKSGLLSRSQYDGAVDQLTKSRSTES